MISIFAKPAFLNINPSQPFSERTKPLREGTGHLMRVSSIIRGEQIADHIGAKLNPTKGYENDICIYVKPMVRKGDDFNFEGIPYLDIIDGHNLWQLIEKHPELKVIVCSQADYETMSKIVKNEIVVIPQFHCNFDRVKRTRTEIKTIGMIGTKAAVNLLPEGFEEAMKERDLEFIFYSRFFSRQDIIDFYMNIDVQIVWRPYKKLLSNPLKIVNASSFGIPTIALDEPAFKEMEGHYMPVTTFDEFLEQLDSLKSDPHKYTFYAEKCIHISEKYHIDKIGEMYKKLK